MIRRPSARALTVIALALWAAALCWADVSWSLRPGLFPILDELNNPARQLAGTYGQAVHLLPSSLYADRPVGWTFVHLLTALFGFSYANQVICLLAIHFVNCGFAFLLLRRLGAGLPISIAGVALFGSLATTAQTATYIAACFDVICLFFLLASTLAIFSERRGAAALSAILFLAALRTKEFAIFLPVLLTLLLALRLPRMPANLRYLYLFREYRSAFAPDNLYFIDLHFATALKSLAYYTELIVGAEESHWQIPPLLLLLLLAVILFGAVARRRAGVAFGVCGFLLMLQPVCFMPNTRGPFYVYTPQLFLILTLCLLAEEALTKRWIAAVCLAVVCLSCCVVMRRRPYFRDRVDWNLAVRRVSSRSAQDVDANLPPMGPGTHVYVSHRPETIPVLFVAGPCSYLQLVNRQRGITCVTDKPADQLLTLYQRDRGPKFLLDYHEDGSVTVASMNR